MLIKKRDPKTGKLKELPRLEDGKVTFPTDMELDHELTLLQAVVNHAVRCRKIASNPLRGVRLLKPDNVRNSVVTEEEFDRLLDAADDWLRPILVIAYDTGMRLGEIQGLTWDRIDLDGRRLLLRADDTKAKRAMVIYLTDRTVSSLTTLRPKKKGTCSAETSDAGKARAFATASNGRKRKQDSPTSGSTICAGRS